MVAVPSGHWQHCDEVPHAWPGLAQHVLEAVVPEFSQASEAQDASLSHAPSSGMAAHLPSVPQVPLQQSLPVLQAAAGCRQHLPPEHQALEPPEQLAG